MEGPPGNSRAAALPPFASHCGSINNFRLNQALFLFYCPPLNAPLTSASFVKSFKQWDQWRSFAGLALLACALNLLTWQHW